MADSSYPHGKRPSDALYEMALAEVEDLILQRIPWPQIVARAISGGLCTSEETVKNWRKEIRRRWAEQDAEEKPNRRDEHREMLRSLYGISFKTADYRNCEKIARQLMILDGLHVPIQVNHTGSIDIAAMSPQQRQAEIDELLKRREAALARVPVGN